MKSKLTMQVFVPTNQPYYPPPPQNQVVYVVDNTPPPQPAQTTVIVEQTTVVHQEKKNRYSKFDTTSKTHSCQTNFFRQKNLFFC
jgi:hypothetical protein